MDFRNEYDGHTLEPALRQVEALTGKPPKTARIDRGYRGKSMIGGTKIRSQNHSTEDKVNTNSNNSRKPIARERRLSQLSDISSQTNA